MWCVCLHCIGILLQWIEAPSSMSVPCGILSINWSNWPSYLSSTKLIAFRCHFAINIIWDFWIPANAPHIIRDVWPLLNVGTTQGELYFSYACCQIQICLDVLPIWNVDSLVYITYFYYSSIHYQYCIVNFKRHAIWAHDKNGFLCCNPTKDTLSIEGLSNGSQINLDMTCIGDLC